MTQFPSESLLLAVFLLQTCGAQYCALSILVINGSLTHMQLDLIFTLVCLLFEQVNRVNSYTVFIKDILSTLSLQVFSSTK